MGCVIAGDSIGVGLADVMRECQAHYVRVGMQAQTLLDHVRVEPISADHIIISIGSNSLVSSADLTNKLRQIRSQLHGMIIWIVPANGARQSVLDAADRNDFVVGFAPGADGVHPPSYHDLATSVRRIID